MNLPELPSSRKEGSIYLRIDTDSGITAISPEDVGPDEPYEYGYFIGSEGAIERIRKGPLVSPYGDLKQISLRDLHVALIINDQGESLHIEKNDGPMNLDFLDMEHFCLNISETEVTIDYMHAHLTQPELSEKEYAQSLQSLTSRYGTNVVGVRYLDVDGTPMHEVRSYYSNMNLDPEVEAKHAANLAEEVRTMVHFVEIRIAAVDQDSPVSTLIDAGRALSAYFEAMETGALTAASIIDLLRGGHAKLLIGQKESAFLEVKSERYNVHLDGGRGGQQKIEMAQDVARFANGTHDAVLVLGFREGKSGQDSVIQSIKEIDLHGFDTETYMKILDSRIVPAVKGLTVDTVQTSPGKGLIYIHVPVQPPEMQPYLVHGVVVEGKVEGAFFSIVERRGEGSITITASQIHGYLVAGKAFLRQQ